MNLGERNHSVHNGFHVSNVVSKVFGSTQHIHEQYFSFCLLCLLSEFLCSCSSLLCRSLPSKAPSWGFPRPACVALCPLAFLSIWLFHLLHAKPHGKGREIENLLCVGQVNSHFSLVCSVLIVTQSASCREGIQIDNYGAGARMAKIMTNLSLPPVMALPDRMYSELEIPWAAPLSAVNPGGLCSS